MENMKLTQEERELIIKKREKSSSKDFNEIYKKVKSIAESRVESVKQMTAKEAVWYENGSYPLVDIYSNKDNEPYLSSYSWKSAGYKFTESQFKKLDKLYHHYNGVAFSLFKELLEKEFSYDLKNLSDDAKEVIFNKSWSDGHSCGYYEVYNIYEENINFVLKCIG